MQAYILYKLYTNTKQLKIRRTLDNRCRGQSVNILVTQIGQKNNVPWKMWSISNIRCLSSRIYENHIFFYVFSISLRKIQFLNI